MHIFRIRPALFGAVLSFALLASCGDADKADTSELNSAAGVMGFVPADTPYLVATPGDLPDDLMDKLEPQVDTVLKAYHSIIRALVENSYAEARDSGADLSSFEKMLPVVEELESLMSLDGLRSAGIERNADIAIYGVGLLPVLRLDLTDGDLLESAISRLEEEAGQKMTVASVDGHSYRYAGDNEGRIVVAIIDNDLVVAAVPTAFSEDLVKQVLGLTPPAQNIAETGVLGDIAQSYGFNDYMIGFMDFDRIAATLLDEQTGINAELVELMQFEDADLTDVCKSEIRSMVSIMPRVVMGYTEIDTAKMSSRVVIELRDDIAAGVSTLTGVVPGLAERQEGLFSIGMSTDLLAARTFYSARLDAIEAEPYKCELFSDIQDGIAAGREVLNQPIPPVVYGFKGFLAVIHNVEGMDLANNIPPTSADMRLLIAMDNVESLIAMGAMFSPELAALNVETDGKPVKLEMPQINATGLDVYLAMTENGLGLSVGEDMEGGLGEMLNADARDPSPFLVVDMDTERYYAFISEAMAAQTGNADSIPELQEAAQAMSRSIQMVMDRVRLVVNFTENGIEVDSEMLLSD